MRRGAGAAGRWATRPRALDRAAARRRPARRAAPTCCSCRRGVARAARRPRRRRSTAYQARAASSTSGLVQVWYELGRLEEEREELDRRRRLAYERALDLLPTYLEAAPGARRPAAPPDAASPGAIARAGRTARAPTRSDLEALIAARASCCSRTAAPTRRSRRSSACCASIPSTRRRSSTTGVVLARQRRFGEAVRGVGAGVAARSRRGPSPRRPAAGRARPRDLQHIFAAHAGLTDGDRGPAQGTAHPRRLPAARPEPEDGRAARHLRAAPERGDGLLRRAAAWWRPRSAAIRIRSGALLLRAGKIARGRPGARAGAAGRRATAGRLGDILVELGAITRRELERQVAAAGRGSRLRADELVGGLLLVRGGPACRGRRAEATVRIPTESLLMEAARRIDEWSRIEAKVPHLGVVPRFADAGRARHGMLDLLPFEWEVLAAVDGARDLRAIADSAGPLGVRRRAHALRARRAPASSCWTIRRRSPPAGRRRRT